MNRDVEDLFHALADLSPTERELEFAKRNVTANVRAQVEAMLRCDSGSEHLLTDCVAGSAEASLHDVGEIEKGARFGPYRLVRLLGRGGMGAVYLAERADGEVEQRVAIKFLRYAGDDPVFRERFLQERQILATLNHPGIARLLDAGHTADRRPYLAMDYVDGIPIDAYAAALDRRAVLELFLDVCDAVSYAHRSLVVHRDLKPSNILVDRQGRPKLLDFGIAKILDTTLKHSQERTATALQALTPQFASPEQVRGEAITTATDVYSLGMVLYRIVTGRLPYAFPSLTPAAIAQTVCEAVPAPSQLSGDLDNILMMALRKEPERRYRSVQEFADDIQRALSDRPVLARPDTIRYRAAKFIQRHRFSAGAAALTLVAIVAGSSAAVYQGRIAQRRFEQVRKLAHTFVFELHDEVAKLQGSTQARQMMVRTGLEYLDQLAQNAGNDLELQKEIAMAYEKIGDAEGNPSRPNLGRMSDALASYRKAGEIYLRMGARNPDYLPELARYYQQFAGLVRFTENPKQARELSESAIQTFERVRLRRGFDAQMERNYAAAWCTLGDIDEDMNHYREAWTEFSRCAELARAQLQRGREAPSLEQAQQAVERMATAGQALGLLTEARQALEEDESLLGELLALQPHSPSLRRREALLHQFRSTLYYDDIGPNLGDPARALESAKRYLESAQQMAAGDPKNAAAQFSHAIAMYRVSYSLREFDAPAAIRMARDSVRMFDELIASGRSSHLVVSRRAVALRRVAEALLKSGLLTEARSAAESGLAAQRKLAEKTAPDSEEHMKLVRALIVTGESYARCGDPEGAESLLQEARTVAAPIAQQSAAVNVLLLARAEEALGTFYAPRRPAEARACYQRLAGLWERLPGPNDYVDQQKAAAARLLASVH